MIAAEAEAAGGAISAKFSSAAPSSIFLERNAPGGGEFRQVKAAFRWSDERRVSRSYRFSV